MHTYTILIFILFHPNIVIPIDLTNNPHPLFPNLSYFIIFRFFSLNPNPLHSISLTISPILPIGKSPLLVHSLPLPILSLFYTHSKIHSNLLLSPSIHPARHHSIPFVSQKKSVIQIPKNNRV